MAFRLNPKIKENEKSGTFHFHLFSIEFYTIKNNILALQRYVITEKGKRNANKLVCSNKGSCLGLVG